MTQLIFSKIIDIMTDLEPIEKLGSLSIGQNKSYKYRKIDDIYNNINPLFRKHGVFTVPEVLEVHQTERQTKHGTVMHVWMKVRYVFYAIDGSNVSCVSTGEGMDSGDKACNKALSGAHKYALAQVFVMATEEAKDSETEHHEIQAKSKQEQSMRVFNKSIADYVKWIKECLPSFNDEDLQDILNQMDGKPLSEVKKHLEKLRG